MNWFCLKSGLDSFKTYLRVLRLVKFIQNLTCHLESLKFFISRCILLGQMYNSKDILGVLPVILKDTVYLCAHVPWIPSFKTILLVVGSHLIHSMAGIIFDKALCNVYIWINTKLLAHCFLQYYQCPIIYMLLLVSMMTWSNGMKLCLPVMEKSIGNIGTGWQPLNKLLVWGQWYWTNLEYR